MQEKASTAPAKLSMHGKAEAWLAVEKFVAHRATSQIERPTYAPYKAGEGALAFAGLRRVEGFTLALLQRGNETLVLPLDEGSEEAAHKLRAGEAVTVEKARQVKASRGRR